MPNTGSVRIAAVIFQGGFAIDELMSEIAARLQADGVRLAGAVQENLWRQDGAACAAMVLTDLKSQRRFSISQELGTEAEGCRLDAAGLAEAGALLDRSIDRDTELLLLNRFGVAEAEGHGLRSIFARAMEAGVPILTAVRPPYTEAWVDFHGGLAVDLPPEREPVLAWARESVRLKHVAQHAVLSPTPPA